jgi:fructose-specific phosphotransferase system IIA component
MKITDFLDEGCIEIEIKSKDKEGAISELLGLLEKNHKISDSKTILNAIMEREKLGSTGIGQSIAVPHAKTDQIETLVGALGISKNGTEFDSLDGEPVNIIFLVLASTKSIGLHLKALAKIARLLKDKVFRHTLLECKTPQEALEIIKEDEEKMGKLG